MALAQNQAAPKGGFSIKEDAPRTGSNLKRDQIWGGTLPCDKSRKGTPCAMDFPVRINFVRR